METITYENIAVSGFPFLKILSIQIRHVPNEHATAEIVGELEADKAEDCVQRVDESTVVAITTTAQGQKPVLFYGCVDGVSLQSENDYGRVNLRLVSMSRLLDVEKKNKTYQNTSMTYGQIIEGSISQAGDLHMMVSDKAIGALIMQYNETGWEFSKRLASKLGAPLVTNVSSPRAQVYVGLPPASATILEDSISYSYGSDMGSYAQTSGAMAQDFSGEEIQSYEYGYLGDEVSFNGKSSFIKSVHAVLTDGVMQMGFALLAAGAAGGGSGGSGLKASGGLAGIAVPPMQNSQASGKMMKGIVQGVQGDKVSVFLSSVDDSYDGGGNWLFPYSTAYSSSDGSGWYCMPEEGDEVMVFFPSGNEGEAFAASSVCASPPSNPKNKCWKAPGGKEILLSEEGLYIISKEGKVFINLTDAAGIVIHSDKDINLSAEGKVKITSSTEINMVAKNQIVIGTEGAYLDLTEGNATLAADQVLLN